MNIIPFTPRPEAASSTTPPMIASPIQQIMQAIEAADLFISDNEEYIEGFSTHMTEAEEADLQTSIAEVKEGRWSLIASIPAALNAAYPEDFKELIRGEVI